MHVVVLAVSFCIAATLCAADEANPTAQLKNEIPSIFTPRTEGFDYIRRTEMIPMRDGVKLYTVILIPRGARRAPILLTRTPYGADERITQQPSKHLSAVLGNKDVVDELVLNEGCIRVLQDVRGTHHLEGDYIMTRPLQGPLNPTNVDHSTDTYDTIDWLVKNIPESNGKVGILGISYHGFTALMALFHPHPALRAAMPINPMVDGWMGDDWSHNGAFRQLSLVYWYGQEATRDHKEKWWSDHFDDLCDWRLEHLIEAHDWIGQRSINPPMDEIVWTPTKIRDFPRHAIPNRLVRFETNPLHRRHVCPPIPTRIHYYAFQDV